MRMPPLDPRSRRAVRLGAFVLAPALAWSLVVSPALAAVTKARAELAEERGLLRREMQLLASAAAAPASFREGATRLMEAAPRLIAGRDDGAASAAFAGYLRQLADGAGVHLTTVEPGDPHDAGGGIRALPAGVAGEGDLEGLMTLLDALESGARLVHLRDLRVESSGGGVPLSSAPAAVYSDYTAAVLAPPEVLAFRFTAAAFTLAAPADSASSSTEDAEDADDAEESGTDVLEREGGEP